MGITGNIKMSLLVFLAQGALSSLLSDKFMRTPTYQNPYQQIPQPAPQPPKNIDIEETEEYRKDLFEIGCREIANTLYDILCEDHVLKVYSIHEYVQWYDHNNFKIQETEKGIKASITVCASESEEERIRHRMRWILYCLPYVQQTPVDFSAELPYIPFPDGCGCIFY